MWLQHQKTWWVNTGNTDNSHNAMTSLLVLLDGVGVETVDGTSTPRLSKMFVLCVHSCLHLLSEHAPQKNA